MPETKKRRTNGFGSAFADVPVIVKKPFDKYFKDENWVVMSENETTTTFEYSCSNSYAGDDESVVDSLCRDFPKDFEPWIEESSHFEIDWDNGVY